MADNSRYASRGVSSSKEEVHRAVAKVGSDEGLFPGAFSKIFPDHLTGDGNYCIVQHPDGSGTKLNAAYLAWLQGIDQAAAALLFRGIAEDSIVMNIDDLICVGAMGPFLVSQTVNRNKFRIGSEILENLIGGCEDFCAKLTKLGIPCFVTSGETADVGDLVRTATVDNTVTARMLRRDVIDASRMEPGDLIVGFSSTGRAKWEEMPNSGIGSNGLTNARHDLLSSEYRVVNWTYAPEMDPSLVYRGSFKLEDTLPGDDRFTVGSALLSPTRTYAPLVKLLFAIIPRSEFHGIIHCSGGGQTKIGKFGRPGNVYRKDHLFPIPPLFELIREASGLSLREMYQCYNMGHRLEAVVRGGTTAEICISLSQSCGIDAQVVGEVGYDDTLFAEGKRAVRIEEPYFGSLCYVF